MMATGLVLLSVLVLLLSVGLISKATLGVAVVAAAVWVAVMARIAQAREQHAELIKRLDGGRH